MVSSVQSISIYLVYIRNHLALASIPIIKKESDVLLELQGMNWAKIFQRNTTLFSPLEVIFAPPIENKNLTGLTNAEDSLDKSVNSENDPDFTPLEICLD